VSAGVDVFKKEYLDAILGERRFGTHSAPCTAPSAPGPAAR
jgi:hypothetical protein